MNNETMRNSQYFIAVGFVCVLLLLVAVGAVGLNSLAAINSHLERIVKVHNVKVELVTTMRSISRDRALALHRLTLASDAFEADEEIQTFSRLASEFIILRERLDGLLSNDREKSIFRDALAEIRQAVAVQQEVVDLVVAGDVEAANRLLLKAAIPAQNQVIAVFNKLVEMQREASAAAVSAAQDNFQSAWQLMLGLGAVALLVGVAIMLLVVRRASEVNAMLEARVVERTQALQDANTELEQMLQTLRDTQQQLVDAEKMASLGNLVAGVAHEINTPIGIGVTSASSLDEEIQALSGKLEAGTMTRSDLQNFLAHGHQACDILLRNMQRAANLIGAFKQVAVDQSSADWRTIDLREYVDEILTSIRPKFKRSGVTVENTCPADLLLHTNPGAIYQIISNLVINAVIHAFDGAAGHISITARRLGDQNLVLECADDGKGISAEHLNRIFDPFFTTRRGQGGSGLGLSIVYNLVTNTLHGRIKVESEPGKGTIFHMVIPIQTANQAN